MSTESGQQTLNISLIGMMAVGKTSITKKFANPEKDISTRNAMTTIGVEQTTCYLKWRNIDFRLKIWDTAGQERFSALTTNFLKPIDGVCLVFAFDSLQSLEQTQKWKESINQVKEMPVVLVGNKADLAQREITPDKIAERQKDLQCQYFECSAYTGKGVEDAIYSIVFECLRPVDVFVKKFEVEMRQQVEGRGDSSPFLDIVDSTMKNDAQIGNQAKERKLTITQYGGKQGKRQIVAATPLSAFQWALAQQVCAEITHNMNLEMKPEGMTFDEYQRSVAPTTGKEVIEGTV